MKTFKKVLSIIMIAAVIASVCVMATVTSGAASTGAGLAEYCLNAYYEGWAYVWGGCEPGAVDCSGLIWSYCGGDRMSMLDDAKANGRDWGYVSSGIPRVHGLGLSRPGHVGVYIADGMEVDARGSDYGVCYESIGGYNNWDCWFKLTAVSYPENGWEQFNGDSYYYEDGEYIVDTSRTIDGVTYYFDSTGACTTTPSSTSSSSSSEKTASTKTTTTTATDDGFLRNGSSGSKVEKLQERLQELGYYNGSIDGDFGDLTEAAFKLFQKTAGLFEDGIAGNDADILYSDDAPAYVKEEEEVIAKKKDTELAETGVQEETPAAEEATEAAPAEDATVSYALGDFADEVALIQERLNTLGYLEATPDGSFGAQTETAVKGFQKNNELVETGVVDEVTYDTLFSEKAVEMPAEVKVSDADTTPAEKINVNAPAQVAPTTTPATAPNTEVEKKTTAVASKSLAGVTDSVDMQKNAKTTNFEFILWLAIMIVVMLITFTIVFTVEKKKQKAAARNRRFY